MNRIYRVMFLFCIVSAQEELFNSWSKTFAEMVHAIQTSYYHTPPLGDAMVKAMKSFVSFDPHSSFLDTKAFDEIMQLAQGTFSGIGVVLDAHATHGPYKLMSVLPLKPADKAGLKAGDFIIALNGQSVLDMPYDTFVEQLRGPRYTTVELLIIRGTELLKFSLVRDLIEDETALSFMIKTQPAILYVSLKQFCTTTAAALQAALARVQQEKLSAMIIDLRDNGGGLLESALQALELFLPKKSIIAVTKNNKNVITESYKTEQEYPHAPLTIIILINKATASAAEIFAGSLRFYAQQHKIKDRVILVGETTFGKGSVQEVIPLSNNCALKLTSAVYFLPGDICIQNCGIEPDISCEKLCIPTEHERTLKQLLGSEKNLPGALIPEKSESIKTPSKDIKTMRIDQLKHDNQLALAITLVQLSNLYPKLTSEALINQIQKLLLHENTEFIELKL